MKALTFFQTQKTICAYFLSHLSPRGKQSSIVAVIIGMCLLLGRRTVAAPGWFKLRGRDPLRLSVRAEWRQDV